MRGQVVNSGALVGTGSVGALVGHTRSLDLYAFAGAVAPDEASVLLTTAPSAPTEYNLYASLHPVVDGGTVTVPPVDMLATTGDTLDAVRLTSAGSGYQWAECDVIGNAGWTVWSPTATLTQRALPHLPSQALESAAESKPTVRVAFSVVADSSDGAPPWQEFGADRQLSIEVVRSVTNSGR